MLTIGTILFGIWGCATPIQPPLEKNDDTVPWSRKTGHESDPTPPFQHNPTGF